MRKQETVVVKFIAEDGKEFHTEAACEIHERKLADQQVYRTFAALHQRGKTDKAVQMVLNILLAFDEWDKAGRPDVVEAPVEGE